MADDQHEIWNPLCERVDGLSAIERADMERARAWAYYINGGGGEPWNVYDGFPTLEGYQQSR
jgi:hypothetical protein